jgi:hypothetical protein
MATTTAASSLLRVPIGYYMTIEERCNKTYDLGYENQVLVRQLSQSASFLLDSLFKKENLVLHLPVNKKQIFKISKASNISPKKALFFPTYDPLVVYESPYNTPLVVINGDLAYIRDEESFSSLLKIINTFDPKRLSKKLGRCIFCLSDHTSSLGQEQCASGTLANTKKKSSRRNRKSYEGRRLSCDSLHGCPIEQSQLLQAEKVLPYVDPAHNYLMNRIELDGLSQFNKKLSSLLAAGLVLKDGLLTFPEVGSPDSENDLGSSLDPEEISRQWSKSLGSNSDSESDDHIQINNAIRIEYVRENDKRYYLVSHYPGAYRHQLLELNGKQRDDKKWIIPIYNEDKLLKLVNDLNKKRKEEIINRLLLES